MNRFLYLNLIFWAICPSLLIGQYVPNPRGASLTNGPIQKLVEEVSPYGWLYFRKNLNIADTTFFTNYGTFFGLAEGNEMRLERKYTDPQGRTVAYFRQYCHGILVEGGEYSLHSQDGDLLLGHGKIVEDLTPEMDGIVENLYALRHAMESLDVATYAWQDPSWEESLQAELEDSTIRYFPQGELRLFLQGGDQMIKSNYRLAWYFEIRSLNPDDFLAVYVDAMTAEVVKVSSLRRRCTSQSGTAKTLYNNYQNLDMKYRGWPNYDYTLKDCREIHTKFHERNSFGETRGWKWTSQITHTDNDWDDTHAAATSAHWAAQQAWDYFDQTFGLKGPDGNEKSIRIWVNWADASGNPIGDAMFEPSKRSNYLYIGTINDRSLATLDIVGHEYAHGVVAAHAGLKYERESGALDESFADIFGLLIEAFGQKENAPSDWLIGEDVQALRSLAHPADYGQPEVYGTEDPNWIDASTIGCEVPTPDPAPLGNDFCGVHTNSGVQNHWFYLLTQGGAFNGQLIYGIGMEKSAQIVFHNLTHYMQSHSNYQDARLGSIQSAKDLFGDCSNEVAQVKNAWAAVGVGDPNNQLCMEIEGPNSICDNQLARWYTYEVTGVEGVEIEWSNLPEDWLYEISGYYGTSLTLKGITYPGPAFELEYIGRTNRLFERQTLTLTFAPCSPGDTVPEIGKQPEPDSTKDWSLIPSSSWERMFVTLPEGSFPASVELVDLRGRRLQQFAVQQRSFVLELAGVSDGIYLLRVMSDRQPVHKVFRVIR